MKALCERKNIFKTEQQNRINNFKIDVLIFITFVTYYIFKISLFLQFIKYRKFKVS